VVVPLVVLLVLWIWFFVGEGAFKGGPNGKSFEADLAMFVGGAQVLKNGGDPYNPAVLYPAERSMLAAQGLAITKKKAIVRVGNPPLFFWALSPLTGLPFGRVGLGWAISLYLLSAAGFLLLLRYLGWRNRLIPLVIFLAMPQVFLGAFYGNVVAIVFFAVSLAVALARRYPCAAGALLVLAWMKPPVALPVAALVFLFHARERGKLVVGFVAATTCLVVASAVATGAHSLGMWVGGMLRYSRDVTAEPDIASLAGLYVRPLSADLRLGIGSLVVLGAVAVTAVMFRRLKTSGARPELVAGWLWLVWFLATPYAHFFDEIMFTLPVLAMMGRDGRLVTRRPQAVTLYLLFLSLIFIEWAPQGVQLLSLPLVLVMLTLGLATRGAGVGGRHLEVAA
jgi:hypothetical protein